MPDAKNPFVKRVNPYYEEDKRRDEQLRQAWFEFLLSKFHEYWFRGG